MYEDIIFVNKEAKAKKIIKSVWGKKPLFICVIANTETGKIKGISVAGENPDLTDFTPPADVELIVLGKCKCIDGVPITPDGIPTPAIITRASIILADIPFLTINSGLNITPQIPYINVGGTSGKDIRNNQAVIDPEKTFERAKLLGKSLSRMCDFLVVGESIAGGTTTALGVLIGLGYNAFGKVSSSMPKNPHYLKIKIVREALEKLNDKDVFHVIQEMGDPMIPVHAGLCIGAGKKIPVFMAGGTQMAAVLSVIKEIEPGAMDNLIIATTNWILNDETSNLIDLVNEICPIPIIAAKHSFSNSKHKGLQAYERGVVREGVGAGGSSIAAYIKSKAEITLKHQFKEIEKIYEELISKQKQMVSSSIN